jgi:hypothetical protein
MGFQKGKHYQKLDIDFPISKQLSDAIDAFINHINNENGMSEDCYRDEIDFWLKDSYGKITEEQYDMIKRYYVWGKIYDTQE